jgi:hypothetical protein
MKLIDVIECQRALSKIMRQQVKAPVKVAYRLQKNLRILEREVRDYQAVNAGLVKKYGTEKKGPDGEPTGDWEIAQPDVDALRAYWAEHDELLDQDVEIDLMPIHIETLDVFSLTVADRASLAVLNGLDLESE